MFARDYQRDMVDAALAHLARQQACLLVAATGLGKTVVAAHLAKRWPRTQGRILILVQRTEALEQTVNTLRAVCQDDVIEIEAGSAYASHPALHPGCPWEMSAKGELFAPGRIVVAMVDTLTQPHRLRRWGRDEIGLLIVDECHHCVQVNKTYVRIVQHFRIGQPESVASIVGLTPVPDRADGISLAHYFKQVAYHYDIASAVQDGWLVPVQQQLVTVEDWDLSRVPKPGHDLSEIALDRVMREEKPCHIVASAARQFALYGGQRRQTLIFTCSVQHAETVADILNRWEPSSACALHGAMDSEERTRELARFRQGEYQYLIGKDLFTEGFDEPKIRVLVIARPTCSRALYAQMVGRGVRPWPDIVPQLNAARDADERRAIIRHSPKPSLLVVDLAGVSARHKLATCADLLGGWHPEPIRDLAIDVIKQWGGRGEVNQALREAQKRYVQSLREAERQRRKDIVLAAKLLARPVDPFELLDLKPKREPVWFRGKKPTPKQVAFLEQHLGEGMPPLTGRGKLTFWKARQLIDKLIKDRAAGPPTEAQINVLGRYGFDTARLTFATASAALEFLQQSGWRLPADFAQQQPELEALRLQLK
jgi:superfamily II DNA or RNA helicase